MGKYKARWRSTGHGGEVQGTIWRSTGHDEEVQGTVRKYRARWRSIGHIGEVQGTVGISKCHFYLALYQKMQEEKMVLLADEWENPQELLKRGGKVICGLG